MEDPQSLVSGACAKLVQSMYGTRDAAANWEAAYTTFLEALSFQRGLSRPCVFHSSKKRIRLMVHGDDFFAIGNRAALEQLRKDFGDTFECKSELIGPHSDLHDAGRAPLPRPPPRRAPVRMADKAAGAMRGTAGGVRSTCLARLTPQAR